MTTDDTLNPQEEPLLDTAGNETAAAETVSGYKPAVKDDNVK